MMFWTLAIQSLFQQALMGFGVRSQLLCLCLSTREGKSQFSSLREVMIYCSINKTKRSVLCFFSRAKHSLIKSIHSDWFFQEARCRNTRTSLVPAHRVRTKPNITFTRSATELLVKQVQQYEMLPAPAAQMFN